MNNGTLYGIGVGPGDPDLITVKAARILETCRHVFVPKSRMERDSLALSIARKFLDSEALIHEILFPMTSDRLELETHWAQAAIQVAEVIERGENACFLTLGDVFLYSTYIYLVGALRKRLPDAAVVSIPGVTAFSASAALAEFPVGKGKESVTILPAAEDSAPEIRRALAAGGSLILMKIGRRLEPILDILEESGAIGRGVFVSRAGMPQQRVVRNLASLRGAELETGYLSLILVGGTDEETP